MLLFFFKSIFHNFSYGFCNFPVCLFLHDGGKKRTKTEKMRWNVKTKSKLKTDHENSVVWPYLTVSVYDWAWRTDSRFYHCFSDKLCPCWHSWNMMWLGNTEICEEIPEPIFELWSTAKSGTWMDSLSWAPVNMPLLSPDRCSSSFPVVCKAVWGWATIIITAICLEHFQ